MKRTALIICMIALFCAFIMTPVSATTWDVYEGQSIQAAIEEASDGDTVFVHAGTYVLKSKLCLGTPNITLKGEGGDKVTLDANGGEAVTVGINSGLGDAPAPGCIVEGFRIISGTHGISILNALTSDCIIRNNILEDISNLAFYSIAPFTTIEDNIFHNCILGVEPTGASTMIRDNLFEEIASEWTFYLYADNITFIDNVVSYSATGGGLNSLYICDCTNCRVANNTFKNSSLSPAIVIYADTSGIGGNIITRNNFTSNYGGIGIELYEAPSVPDKVYLNNIDTSNNVIVTAGITPSNILWNSTVPIEYTYNGATYTDFIGNRWGDYTGSDDDGDGIGDASYMVPDGLGDDYRPMMTGFEDYFGESSVGWYVDDDGGADFTTIQAAVTAATAGDSIIVKDGAYTENVLVDKTLSIVTENGSHNVIVTAIAPDKPVFDVDADGVTVEGFAVRGPTNSHIAGIEIISFNDCVITGNDCTGCYNGIHLGGDATENTVEENYCHENTRRGISLRDTVHDNLIYNNTCENNEDDEICVKDTPHDNIIWANTFNGTVEFLTENTYHSPTEVTYTYDGTEYTGFVGNSYSLYTGEDADSNGIGDTPMSFGTYADDYPMMGAWQDGGIANNGPSINRISLLPDAGTFTIGETQQFNATAYDALDTLIPETAFVWASSNTSVGTVNTTGYFEAIIAGTTNVTAIAGGVTGTATVTVTEETPSIEWAPYVTGTTTTAATIHWRTDLPVGGSIEYADESYFTTNSGYENTLDDLSENCLNHVALTGLTPNTRYHYRVMVDGTVSSDRTFRTFPESGEFTFIVYGDTQESQNFTQLERHSLVAARVAEEDPLFVLHLGDTVNMVDDADEWGRFFEAGGPVFANTSLFTTLGNHEENSSNYYEAFGFPEWYSFDCAGAHIAVLDSNDWTGDNMDYETTWLSEDLSTDADWKFVAFHHPPYSSDERHPGGWTYLRDEWGPAISENKVSVVFSGHVHTYERYLEDGVQYVVTGTGGGPLYPLSTNKSDGYQNSLQHTLGYTKVTVHENGSATMEFIEVALVSDDNTEVLTIYPENTVFDPVMLTAPVDLPDLSVTSLEASVGVMVGEDCTIHATVKNIGDLASGSTTAILLKNGTEIEQCAVVALSPGNTTVLDLCWKPDIACTANLTLVVDPDALIEESDWTNNARSISVTVLENTGPETQENETLVLNPGWNFVSVPKRLSSGNDTGSIFLDVDTGGHALYSYNATSKNWLQVKLNTSISPLEGYWIYANTTTNIPLSYDNDPLTVPAVVSLVSGWNAIGFSDINPVPAKYTLSSLGDSWTTLIGYDSVDNKYGVSIINGAENSHSDLREMQPMKGYWIFMRDDALLCAISV